MQVLSLPAAPRALIFDFDGTLYTNKAYQAFQEEVLVERLAAWRGEAVETTQVLLASMRAEREAAGLGRTSMGRLFVELGVDIGTSVQWRKELIEPCEWLSPDPRLEALLSVLEARYPLILVTNNPRSVGEKGLAALGLRQRFRAVVGLDDTMVSKPGIEPFIAAAAALEVAVEACISIGDRRDVDLVPALELGMGAILVDGVEDLFELPSILR